MTTEEIYAGSNGDATRDLYARLAACGPVGVVAVNLFRAMKASERAKIYRGAGQDGSYRALAYQKKDWSLKNLVTVLQAHGAAMGFTYGWQEDPATPKYSWVLYVDLPDGFQVSYHAAERGLGPDYGGTWDGERRAGAARVIRFCEAVLATAAPVPAREDATTTRAPESRTLGPRPTPPTRGVNGDESLFCPRCAVWWISRVVCPVCQSRLIDKARTKPEPALRPGVQAEW